MAVIAASHFLPEAQDLRSQLAASIGGQESGVYLLRGYGDLVMRGETENVEHIDRMISEHPVVGEWAREFVAKGGEVGKPPRVIMCWEFQSSPVEKNGNGIRHWLFRRK